MMKEVVAQQHLEGCKWNYIGSEVAWQAESLVQEIRQWSLAAESCFQEFASICFLKHFEITHVICGIWRLCKWETWLVSMYAKAFWEELWCLSYSYSKVVYLLHIQMGLGPSACGARCLVKKILLQIPGNYSEAPSHPGSQLREWELGHLGPGRLCPFWWHGED